MSENNQSSVNGQTQVGPVKSAAEAGLARRKLIRAGLAAGPVMLGLTSQSALAIGSSTGSSCKPSIWSSLKAAKGCRNSHTDTHLVTYCGHYDDWTVSTHSECGKKFHTSTSGCVPFTGSYHGTKTVKDVCRSTGTSAKDKLSKHCAAMYLNNTASTRPCPVDVPTVKAMWTACKDGAGTWSPAPGSVGWTRDDCNEYFDYICKGTKPASWTGTACA